MTDFLCGGSEAYPGTCTQCHNEEDINIQGHCQSCFEVNKARLGANKTGRVEVSPYTNAGDSKGSPKGK